jgi:hypothetical protein
VLNRKWYHEVVVRQQENESLASTGLSSVSKPRKITIKLLNLLVGLSFLGLAYCILGVIQTGMLAGAPTYSPIRAAYNERFWTRLSGVSLGLATIFLGLRSLIRRRESKSRRVQGHAKG